MNEIARTTQATARRPEDRLLRARSKPGMRVDEMTYLVLISVAAAFLAGALSLPVTLPVRAFAEAPPAFGAVDAARAANVRTAGRFT